MPEKPNLNDEHHPASRVQGSMRNRPRLSAGAQTKIITINIPPTMRIVRYSYPNFRSLGGVSRSPWSGLESEIDRLFETALGSLANPAASTRFPVDLYEDSDNTYVRAELPGINRADINVEMVEDYLTISGTRKSSPGEKEDGQAEQSFSFSRSVTIPEQVQSDKVSAAYENGVLTVILPKREEAKPRKVTVAIK